MEPVAKLLTTTACTFTCWALAGCSAPASNEPPVFGGEGAVVEQSENEIPLGDAGKQDAVAQGPCAKAAPAGDRLEVDDFEDGDSKIFKVFEREGWWYTATDGTEGQKVFPDEGSFKPVLLPEAEATQHNEYAAHLMAEGQTDWGVVWGTTLKWTREGIGCPFNASDFEGLEFRAKGPATIWLNFATPDTTPEENGGTCKKGCWDSYGKLVRVKEGWNHYVVRWNELQQQGWGTDVRFDNERLMNINFSAKTEYLPVELWVDDIRFLGKDAPPPAASTPAAATPKAPEATPTRR